MSSQDTLQKNSVLISNAVLLTDQAIIYSQIPEILFLIE